MKKIYREQKYLKWKRGASLKTLRAKEGRRKKLLIYKEFYSANPKWENYQPIEAPANFSFTDNPAACSAFFNKIRNKDNHYYRNNHYFVGLELKNVVSIDYCSVSLLKAMLDEFKPQDIQVQGSSPTDTYCNQFLVDSGFYDGLHQLNNKPIHLKGNNDRIMFTKGAGSLSDEEDKQVVAILKKVRLYLTNENAHCPQLRTIILEICGNSIEHSESYQRQWTLGVKYEHNHVTITLIDMGKGILKTLYKKLGQKFVDFLSKSEIQILEGAFDKKYASRTLDTNRNKGLPVIKKRYNDGHIKNIVVITNNVLLNFDKPLESQYFSNGFKGTIFKIELDKSCFHADH